MSTHDETARGPRLPGGAGPFNSTGMKIPRPDQDQGIPDSNEAYIPNAYAGKELLSPRQAVDCINYLSAALLADGRKRNGSG